MHMQTKISDYIVGIILFVLVIVSGISMVTIYAAQKSSMATSDYTADFNSTFNKYQDINETLYSMSDSIQNAETDAGLFGVLNALINSAYQYLRLMFQSLGFMNDAFRGLTAFFGVSPFISGTLILLVITVIGFAIYSAIFQREL